MNSEFDVLNTGATHRNRPAGDCLVRSLSGTRYVRGWLRKKERWSATKRILPLEDGDDPLYPGKFSFEEQEQEEFHQEDGDGGGQ